MFDIGFSELVVVAVVALIVVGPERLPKVARTVGHLLGRFQRYVSDVKSDIDRELRLEEMKKLRAEVEMQARQIETQVGNEARSVEQQLSAPAAEVGSLAQGAGDALRAPLESLESAAAAPPATAAAAPSTLAVGGEVHAPSMADTAALGEATPGGGAPAVRNP